MLDQLVAAQHFVVTLAHLSAVILISYRWRDAHVREAGWSAEVIIMTFWIAFSAAAALAWLFWTLRWFVKTEVPSLSLWYVQQAWITVPLGVIISASVAGAGAGMLWPSMRWAGVALATATAAGAWVLAFWTVGLI